MFFINNAFLVTLSAIVLLGTIYPIIYEIFSGGDQITVGAPYFNMVTVPFALVLLFFQAIGPLTKWGGNKIDNLNSIGIIIISSIAAIKGSPILGAYNISKAADVMIVKNIATEFGHKNIRANSIAPGLIKTDFAKALWENPDILKTVLGSTPMKRIGDPDEIAGVAIMLASDAGNYINGQTIVVDGGTTIS